MLRINLWKIFHLPSPKELGWSKNNALAMGEFCRPGDKTWTDWKNKMQLEYPTRYFFAETLPFWFYINFTRRIKNSLYWIRSHTYNKYHILDLRQPIEKDGIENLHDSYRWGYICADTKMLFALFNILNDFVENEFKDFYCPTEEDIANVPTNSIQRDAYFEILALHKYWNIDRKKAQKEMDKLLDEWMAAKSFGDPNTNKLFVKENALQKAYEDQEEEMLIKLIKIRKSLWI